MPNHPNRSQPITIDKAGPWNKYVDSVPPGFEPRGTVTRADGSVGALLFCPATGKYIQANGGDVQSLDQRRVKAALGISNNAGAPVALNGGFIRCNLSLDAATREIFERLGSGKMSEGARIAAKIAASQLD